jgi:hypothetical protein
MFHIAYYNILYEITDVCVTCIIIYVAMMYRTDYMCKMSKYITSVYFNYTHVICKTRIFLTNYLLHVSMFVSSSSGIPYMLKSYKPFGVTTHRNT